MARPGGPVAQRLWDLFKANQRSVGQYSPDDGKVHTLYRAPTVGDWEAHLNAKVGVGCVPIQDDATVWWAAIDIDNHGDDKDIPIAALDVKAREHKLPVVLCRSKSGGVHAYLFLKRPEPAPRVRALMARWAEVLGFKGAEIFPKQGSLHKQASGNLSLGNWINMPYFGGTDTGRYAFHSGKKLTVEQFLDTAESSKADDSSLMAPLLADHPDAPPCIQHLLTNGAGQGTRNEAMFNITVYLRRRDPESFRSAAAELNQLIFDKPLPKVECQRTILSGGRPDYSYRCGEEPIVSACDRDACLQRKYGITDKDLQTQTVVQDLPEFSNLTKFITDPVRWEMTVGGKRVANISTPQLLDWKFMRELIAEKLLRIVPMIKAQEWERILQPLMETVRIVDTPDDASVSGIIRMRLREFSAKCDLSSRGEDPAERMALLRGQPVVVKVDGARCVTFRAQDFVNYLKRTKSEELKGVNLWFAVRELGVIHQKIRVGKSIINVWYMPVQEVIAEEGEPDTPKFKSNL